MKKLLIILSVFFICYCIYTKYTATPEVYITTNIYDGYVVDNYYCSKHSTRFIDSKSKKTVVLDHTSNYYLIGKYKAEIGDHYKIVETVTKKIYYHSTYKVYYNGKIISNNNNNIRIYKIY